MGDTGQMVDAIDADHRSGQGIAIENRAAKKLDTGWETVRIATVEHSHRTSRGEQGFNEMATDKAASAGDEIDR
ncbi:hypothetical protein MOX02_42620 [Methylobacterium oxalidis]|nr:hypothetical protein MOX02_42620 [Methylobacterium oxalidis]